MLYMARKRMGNSRILFLSIRSETLSTLALMFDGYGITCLAACGIILNILGLILLFGKSKRKKMFNLLLSALLLFDTLFLTFNLLKSVANHFIVIPSKYLVVYWLFVYPGSRFSLVSSILMTIALSHTRFRAVSKPIHHLNLLKSPKDRLKYLLTYIIPIIISAIILTIPSFWEIEISNKGSNTTQAKMVPTDFRQNPYYSMFYVGILCLVLLGIFPFTCLVYFTYKISTAVSKNSLIAEQLNESQKKDIKIFNQKLSKNRALVANLIAVFFLTFHALRLSLTVVELIGQLGLNKNTITFGMGCEFSFWINVLTSISELLLVINSSINVIIYQSVNIFRPSPIIRHQSNFRVTPHSALIIHNSNVGGENNRPINTLRENRMVESVLIDTTVNADFVTDATIHVRKRGTEYL